MAQTDAPTILTLRNPDDCTVEAVMAFEPILDRLERKERVSLTELITALAPMTDGHSVDDLRAMTLGDLKRALYAFRDAMVETADPN